mmetsp:Transcript_98573/g.257627  ORF Transcript_98573/g.257627 Transcript_98573/m.257627 type:complete len:230 (-) Transcript_98573:40-729(-)
MGLPAVSPGCFGVRARRISTAAADDRGWHRRWILVEAHQGSLVGNSSSSIGGIVFRRPRAAAGWSDEQLDRGLIHLGVHKPLIPSNAVHGEDRAADDFAPKTALSHHAFHATPRAEIQYQQPRRRPGSPLQLRAIPLAAAFADAQLQQVLAALRPGLAQDGRAAHATARAHAAAHAVAGAASVTDAVAASALAHGLGCRPSERTGLSAHLPPMPQDASAGKCACTGGRN